ncbi:MAG: serine/threonine-protein kinase [Myxococcota bacterium]
MSSDGRAPRTLSDADETVSLDRAPSEGPLPEVGAKIDRFVVLEHLGSGGMGVVYLAYDPDLDRNVALKVLGTSNVLDPNASRRLLREAQALARLSHPNVVVVHEVGMTADGVFIAMEHIPGDTLHRWFMEGHDWREIVRVFIAAGRGLWAAHQAGVVHRDFKPANVLMGRDASRPRVVDFGLARPPAPSVESSAGSIERSADGSIAPLTQAGAIMGTPRYMSPEQHRGDPGDPASDQYAFCVALFEGLHGAPPFTGRTLHALAVAKAKDAPDSPLKAGVPARLNHIMMRGLSSAPDKRFATMQELLRALERVVAPRRRANFIAVPVAAVAAAGAWFASASPGDPSSIRIVVDLSCLPM